uniref:cGMP-dependent protein kinase n=1 Tax=Cynoglossus semilaevis TaxID=244447 RepID=A0A3P8WBI1_CYNSE
MGTLRDLQFALQLKIEELRQRDTLIDELELELDAKDELIRRLQDELDRYRANVFLPGASINAGSAAQCENKERSQKRTIITEPWSLDPLINSVISQKSCEKSEMSLRRIQAAILKNDLLKNLDEGEIRAIMGCMYPTIINQGGSVIEEGTSGDQAFVVEEGRLEVTKEGVRLLTVEPEDMFGELSLLYNCTHTYSVSAQMDTKLWIIDYKSYWTVLMQSGLSRLHRSMELLSSVPFLQSLPEDVIMKMSDLMEETHYTEGAHIVQQGATGDTFYIISKGQVKVTERKTGQEEESVLSKLSEGHWFGEKFLWGDDVWTENVVAAAAAVTCLVINRETYKDIINGMEFNCCEEKLRGHDFREESDKDVSVLSASSLSDFNVISPLAETQFGHVDLVKLKSDTERIFALRVLKKKIIINSSQQEHVLREGRILMEAHCPFIVRLYKAFKDPECLYIVTEACLGGNLHNLLKEKGHLDECSTRFYTACVVEALTFLHSHGVIYRDVKPENVLLDERGYAKLIGSRCMKKVEMGRRTWTFCGTPGYMSPEIILGRGHGPSSDLWSLGVFVFELLSGGRPFSGSDPLKIFTATICGIDQIDFPKRISQSASSFIRKLCRWFEGFDWDGFRRKTLIPLFIPKVNPSSDTGSCADYSVQSVELCTDWDDF